MAGFSRRRGRPRQNIQENDKGTFELRQKRNLGITIEAIDLCLKKSLITQEQHNAAMRLRWLYTLKFGAPGISAYNFDDYGVSCKKDPDEAWLKARSEEYKNALSELDKAHARSIVLNICVFNQRAAFLFPYPPDISRHELKSRNIRLLKFKEGMEILESIL